MESALVKSTVAPSGPHDSFSGVHVAFFTHLASYLVNFRLELMLELKRLGAHVTAISPPGESLAVLGEYGIDLELAQIDRRSFNPMVARRDIQELTQVLKGVEPDILQTYALRPNAYGSIAGRNARVPAVVNTVTGLGSLYAQDFGIKGEIAKLGVNALTRQAMRFSSAVVFQNPDDRDYYLRKKLCQPSQVRMILGSGVDTERFSPSVLTPETREIFRNKNSINANETVVLMISRLLQAKGVLEFMQAARLLRGQAKFILVGGSDHGNPASYDVQQLQEKVDVDVLQLTGHQDNISEWLSISDIFVLPSYREGLPRTILEAMACGLPVVTTDVPGCRDTVAHEVNGLLVPAKDSGSLSKAIEQLIRNVEIREEMGLQSRNIVVKKFSNQVILNQYLDLYQECLATTASGARS